MKKIKEFHSINKKKVETIPKIVGIKI